MNRFALPLAFTLLICLSTPALPAEEESKASKVGYVVKEVVLWPFRVVRALLKLPAYALDGNLSGWASAEP